MTVRLEVSMPQHFAASRTTPALTLTAYRVLAKSLLDGVFGGKLGRWLARSGFDEACFHGRLFVQSRGLRPPTGSPRASAPST